jgi:hypothetical protein
MLSSATAQRPLRRRRSLPRQLLLALVVAAAVAGLATAALLRLPALSAATAGRGAGVILLAQPLRLVVARGRTLLAQLEGSLAFNLGQASTTTKFKIVPKGKGGSGNGGGGAGGGNGAAATPRGGNGGGNGTCALTLTREQAGKLGQALVGASKPSSGGLAVKVGDVSVQVGSMAASAAAGGGG